LQYEFERILVIKGERKGYLINYKKIKKENVCGMEIYKNDIYYSDKNIRLVIRR